MGSKTPNHFSLVEEWVTVSIVVLTDIRWLFFRVTATRYLMKMEKKCAMLQLDSELFAILGGGLFTILGVIVGWLLNEFSVERRSKPKLCFKLDSTPDEELVKKELRTKTSLSEYGIEIYNLGTSPFILASFQLLYKNKLLVDCHFCEQSKVILPYHSELYTLMEQETNALERHCKELNFKQCKAIAYSVDGQHLSTRLDVSWIAMRSH